MTRMPRRTARRWPAAWRGPTRVPRDRRALRAAGGSARSQARASRKASAGKHGRWACHLPQCPARQWRLLAPASHDLPCAGKFIAGGADRLPGRGPDDIACGICGDSGLRRRCSLPRPWVAERDRTTEATPAVPAWYVHPDVVPIQGSVAYMGQSLPEIFRVQPGRSRHRATQPVHEASRRRWGSPVRAGRVLERYRPAHR